MRKIREWHTQLSWWFSAIFATGAVWYFLSVKNYFIAAASAVVAVALAFFAVILHRIRDSQEHQRTNESSQETFSYKEHGRFGKNILSGHTHEVVVGHPVSLQAKIPPQSKLHIVLSGLPPIYLDDPDGAWYFSIIGIQNWTHTTYQTTKTGGEQFFDAEAGDADLKITFQRAGKLTIKAYENGSHQPTWQRSMTVNAA